MARKISLPFDSQTPDRCLSPTSQDGARRADIVSLAKKLKRDLRMGKSDGPVVYSKHHDLSGLGLNDRETEALDLNHASLEVAWSNCILGRGLSIIEPSDHWPLITTNSLIVVLVLVQSSIIYYNFLLYVMLVMLVLRHFLCSHFGACQKPLETI